MATGATVLVCSMTGMARQTVVSVFCDVEIELAFIIDSSSIIAYIPVIGVVPNGCGNGN